jgi:hypothetical protein
MTAASALGMDRGIACARVGPFMPPDIPTFERLYRRIRCMISKALSCVVVVGNEFYRAQSMVSQFLAQWIDLERSV